MMLKALYNSGLAQEATLSPDGLAAVLRLVPLFAQFDEAFVRQMAARLNWFSLPGGATLFEAGDAPDAMYFVASGALGAFNVTATGFRRSVGRVSAGETVGEMALISGRPRSATVIALRDTQLAQLSRTDFEALVLSHPDALLKLTQLMVQRLHKSQQYSRGRAAVPRTIALVPHALGDRSSEFATQLVAELKQIGRAALLCNDRSVERTSDWFHSVEREHDFVVYLCDIEPSGWTRLCLRQADAVVLLAQADSTPSPWRALSADSERAMLPRRVEMVLVHPQSIVRGAVSRWLHVRANIPHHHVRTLRDIARLARSLAGTAVGLVLSGGGARTFAHLGALRAIQEAGIEIDAIGGASVGAIIGAGVASEWQYDELIARMREGFARYRAGARFAPFAPRAGGRNLATALERAFADTRIEDLPRPYFCVSANLTTGGLAVHRHGELRQWLRASAATPGIVPPVASVEGVFIDGASINNLPVDVMRQHGIGRVIGIDVGTERARMLARPGNTATWLRLVDAMRGAPSECEQEVLWRAGMLNGAAQTNLGRELSDVLLQPALDQIGLLSWPEFDRVVNEGYEHARARLASAEVRERLNGPLSLATA